ncbi:MAG: HAD family phosphatase [Micavibrio aeruginosavorus]|uniref:HAD family phosphatase n=1 Tax=Micavibrio aeruginosavorus TaxID=349221 RepID=A0A7T5R388_9BACT|nr:MAG: HAD family phosphatase [Micavibrio aeruginosavorus]
MPLVLFDCDGVLVNTEELAGRLSRQFLAQAGLVYQDDVFDRRLAGTSFDDFRLRVSEDFLKATGKPIAVTFFDDMNQAYLSEEARHIRPIPGVRDFIEALVSAQIPFAVASNSASANTQRKLGLVGLLDFFKGRIFSRDDVPQGKPAPDIYLHAMQVMGKNRPDTCIVVEDSPIGVAAGHAAGMYVVGFSGGAHRPAGYAEGLRQAGAAFTADTMPGVAFEAFDQIDEIKFGAQGRNYAMRQRRKAGHQPG